MKLRELRSASAPLICKYVVVDVGQRYISLSIRMISMEDGTEADDKQKPKKSNLRPRCDSNAQSLVPKTNALTIRPRGQTVILSLL